MTVKVLPCGECGTSRFADFAGCFLRRILSSPQSLLCIETQWLHEATLQKTRQSPANLTAELAAHSSKTNKLKNSPLCSRGLTNSQQFLLRYKGYQTASRFFCQVRSARAMPPKPAPKPKATGKAAARKPSNSNPGKGSLQKHNDGHAETWKRRAAVETTPKQSHQSLQNSQFTHSQRFQDHMAIACHLYKLDVSLRD